MSGFNLDFSGMFSGGFTNNLNKNNFNFSAYAPKKEETVVDPIDVVSNKTPEAKVEILEGAGTVAITKQPEVRYSSAVTNAIAPITPDPIEQAIQSVQPKPIDLGMDFSVAPIAETSKPMQSVVGSGTSFDGFNVTEPAVDNMVKTAQTNEDILNPLVSNINKFEVGAGQAGLIDNNTAEQLKSYVGTAEFSNVLDQYSQARIGEQTGTWEGGASRDVLNALGIPHSFETQDEFGRTSVYNFDEQTNDFELVQEYGGTTKENEMIKAVAETAVIAMATAGLGSTLSASLNVSTSAGAAIASGAVSAAQGGNLEEVVTSALSAGFAEEVKGLQTAAEAVGATKEVIAFADTMKNIQTGVNLIKAVDSGDVLGAISSTLDLTGNGSPASYIKEALGTSDAQTAGILKVIDKQLQGESLDDSLKSGAATWVKEGGIKEIDLDFDFGDGSWETPEAIKAIGDKLVEGASWANENFIRPVVDTVETLGQGAIEAASQANQFVQREIIDEVQVYMSDLNRDFQREMEPLKQEFSQLNTDVREGLSNFEDKYLNPINEDISKLNNDVRDQLALFDQEELQPIKRDIEMVINEVDEKLSNFNQDYIKPIDQALSETNRQVRDSLSDFEDEYIDPIKEDVETLAGEVKQGLSETNQYVRESLSEFDDGVLQPIKNEIEDILGNLDGFDIDMSAIKKLLGGLIGSVGSLGMGLETVYTQGQGQGPDNSALAKMNTQFGEQYQFEDLRNNPLLKNELFA